MVDLNPEMLREFSVKVRLLLEEFGIEPEKFVLSIQVPRAYYEAIKANFPDRHLVDMVVTAGERHWHIKVLCARG